jgi:hypothetical protein
MPFAEFVSVDATLEVVAAAIFAPALLVRRQPSRAGRSARKQLPGEERIDDSNRFSDDDAHSRPVCRCT